MGPNVLVVVFDAARRDALEPYGAAAGSTPVVAELARRGRALDRVYATAPWTVPSHVSMFTGLLPRAAGLARAGSPARLAARMRPHRERLLPEVMRSAGYETAATSANLWLSRATGFDTGFDEFVEADTGRNGQIRAKTMRARLRWYAEALQAEADDGANLAERAMGSWSKELDGKPFFWFVNLLECHSPYLPPRPHGGWSPVSRLLSARDARRHYTLVGLWRACAGVDRVPEASLARLRRFYDASIRYMDDWLARILELLDSRGVLDDTLVIVLSDHGENFGEEGLIGHGFSLDNRLINVPFVAAGPGAEALSLTSLVDLPRCLARIAGVDQHPWGESPSAEVAVAQFDPPVLAHEEEKVERLPSVGIDGEALERFVTPLTCAVRDDVKLVRRGSEELVFDLAADPDEARPVPFEDVDAATRRDLAELRGALELGGAPDHQREAEPVPAPSEEELRKLEERMKLLGYM